MAVVEDRIGRREVGPLVGAAALLAARARTAATSRASGCGSPSSRSRPSASRSRPACCQVASRVVRLGGAGGSPAAGAARRAGAGSPRPDERGPASEHEALRERVRGEAVGAVQARAGALADREQAADRGAAVEVATRCRPSRSGSRARRERARAPGRGPASRSAATTFGKRPGSTARMSSHTHGSPRARMVATIARATSSRGRSSSTKRSPLAVVQRGALAADRLGDEEALAALDAGHRRGVELDELEVGEHRAGGAGEQEPGAVGARRVGGARPQRRGAAGGEHDRAREPPLAGVESRRPRSGRRRRSSAVARRPSRTSMASSAATSAESSRRIRRPVALPPACATRRTRVAALEPEREPPVGGRRRSAPRAARGRGSAPAPRRTAPRPPSGARGRGRRRACPRGAAPASRRRARAAASPPWAQ